MRVVICPECSSTSVDCILRKIDRWPNPTVDEAAFKCRDCKRQWSHDYLAPRSGRT